MSATERLLSSGDVCEITRLEPHVLNDWCVKGIVKPAEGGEGQGSHRRFTVMQAIGIMVGVELRSQQEGRGCVLSYVGKIIAAFGSMTDSWLRQQFDKGKTCFVMVHHDKPLLDGKQYDWPDVKRIYEHVTTTVAQIECRLKDHVGGRTRGLAGARKRQA